MSDILGIKVHPPRWDSTKRDEWATFATDFESFVEFQGGEDLVTIFQECVNPRSQDLLPTNSTSLATDQDYLDASSDAGMIDTEQSHDPEPTHTASGTAKERFQALSPDLRRLDNQLYHVLKLSIKGPSHDLILHSQKSFIQAFVILHNEHAATNTLRKTALLNRLLSLQFDGNIIKFKQDGLQLIRDILRANITVQDIIIQCLLDSLQSEQFQGFKLMAAKQLDDTDETPNPYDFLTGICNAVEQCSAPASKSHYPPGEDLCNRCKRAGHKARDCYAIRDNEGNNLDPRTATRKPTNRAKGHGKGRGKGKGQGSSSLPTTNSGKLSDILSHIKANKTTMSLDEVKAAVSNATSMYVRTELVGSQEDHQSNTSIPTDISCRRVQERDPEEQAALDACIESLEEIIRQATKEQQRDPFSDEARGIDDVTVDLLMSLVEDGSEQTARQAEKPLKSRAANRRRTSSDPSASKLNGKSVPYQRLPTEQPLQSHHDALMEECIDDLLEICAWNQNDTAQNSSTEQAPHNNQKPASSAIRKVTVLDSGSGCHLFSDVQVTNSRERMKVSGFKGEDSTISSGTGPATVTTTTDSGDAIDIKLTKVHNIDGLPDDIVSLARLVEDSGYTFVATPSQSYLQGTDSTDRIPVLIADGVFVLGGHTSAHYIKSNQKVATWQELHRRLGHCSKEAAVNTLNNTYGIKCSIDDFEDFFCPTCGLANSRRNNISASRNPDTKATKVGQRIYADIKSFKNSSRSGYHHYILYVDEATDYIAIYPLKRKADAADTLKDLNVELALDKLTHQVVVRPDGDPSCFDCHAFKDQAKTLGFFGGLHSTVHPTA